MSTFFNFSFLLISFSSLILLVFRFGEYHKNIETYQKILKHETYDCKICFAEEQKSPGSGVKINRTKILEKVILPKNECWFCDITFDSNYQQKGHFSEIHECNFCGIGFECVADIKEHENNYHCVHCKKLFHYTHDKYFHDHEEECEMKE